MPVDDTLNIEAHYHSLESLAEILEAAGVPDSGYELYYMCDGHRYSPEGFVPNLSETYQIEVLVTK